jgi:arylsulfatase A-like enzyme
LVSRSPESLRFEVTLPEKPWLDLNVGTVEEIPPRFSVSVAPSNGEPSIVEHYQVEEPESWMPIRLDLTELAGETVEVTLSSTTEAPGTLAFWGSPVIRNSTDVVTRPQAVVVFLADTLRSDHLEAWGHDRATAPTLTGLATQGVRFSDVIAQATWTKVSVSSILTSLYPSTTGIIDLNDRLAAAETTLAEAFRQAGYATFATSSVPFSGQLTNLHQGVEVLYEFGANAELKGDYQSKTAKVWVDQYLKWLELHHDVPTFALIHAMDPHSPFKPATPYDTLWTDDADAEQFEKQSAQLKPHIESPLLRRFMAPTSEEIAAAGVDEASFLRHEKNWYDGSIRGLDAQLERLINRLDELGLGQRTLLAFIADHGEAFLEHGEHWHGNNVYGEVANVPWVLWGQGVPSGQVVEETVQNLDIMPTLLALSGIPIPERVQGRSLVPLLSGTANRALPAFTEHRVGPEEADAFSSFAMVLDGKKLIWNIDPPKGRSVHELYDHKADPLDLKNIAGEHPDLVRKMATELESWQTWAEGQKLDQDAVASDLSAEELERLRSLGYVE